MLVRSMQERALGALLGSEGTANVLYKHLVDWWQTQVCVGPTPINLDSLRKTLQDAIEADINARTGNRHRLNEVQRVSQDLCESLFLDRGESPIIDESIDALLVWDRDAKTLHFREEQVQRYAQTLSELDPTVLVTRYLANRATQANWSKQDLQEIVIRLKTLFVGPKFFSEAFAEGHVHLGGIAGEELVLAQLVLGHQWPAKFQVSELHVGRLRRIRRMLMALTDNWGSQRRETTQQEIVLLSAVSDDAQLVPRNPAIDWGFLLRGLSKDGEVDHARSPSVDEASESATDRWLLIQLAAEADKHNLQQAWIWLFFLLWRTYQRKSIKPSTRIAVLLVVADIMVLRRQMIMNGSGLRRFTDQFFSALRIDAASHGPWEKTAQHEAARRLFARHGDKAEIKLHMDRLSKGDTMAAFAQNVSAHMEMLARSKSQASVVDARMNHADPRSHWHICANFNRAKKSSRSTLWREAKALNAVLHSVPRWNLAPPEDFLKGQPEHTVHPTEIIRGLDVVGDETQWSTERFAPMLRWLRARTQSSRLRGGIDNFVVPTTKLHLSIHAGEDYAHPLSGLRHVDETVRFCHMRRGDRLGHALALGIAPDEWLKKHGEVLLSVDEHFDNLVWAWREAGKLKALKEAQCAQPRLEKRIARMLRYVSWYPWKEGMPEPTKEDIMRLYMAWKLRRNCAYKALSEISNTGIAEPELIVAAPELSKLREYLKKPSIHTSEGLYALRAHLEANSPTAPRKKAAQVRLTVLPHGHLTRRQALMESQPLESPHGSQRRSVIYLYDHDDPNDLRFMLAMQDICLERYSRLGLSIETNPSSNVYIGQLETHSDHPIYRWNPLNPADLEPGGQYNQFSLRKRSMPVTINTDDPGLIPTTLRMEHHLIHEAAIDHGHSKEMADNWIEQIRQQGMANFDRAH
ncbi:MULTISPECIES: antiviral RADAR system adenosine deaminase RdrB [Pseudomonas]|uniref:antiviral RADAR system adenosine deaminase RdrB n=1 Tax=Pseudomonas TaxID=286 RepID=UPI00131F4EAA|nr:MULTISPECIES: antiviral RADAR system adenosine deaminase RdrB [Pseudomonas]MCP1512898.1 hypothetical protein [Pseudomonas rhodesiae]MDF9771756.1 hypothetical protein [Pseudomonas rhodesiae]QHC99493.1 hypothetical protein PspS04_03565 [Pseudomonas sp. S04]QHF31977.1 hypothetical protein PspS19_03565 [Pseudomonas sp. S19]